MPDPIESSQQAIWAEAELPAREPEPIPSEPEPERAPRLRTVNRNQLLLRTVDVEKLVEPDHVVRAIWELVGRLDLSRFRQGIDAVEGTAGRPAFDPHLLISLWIYAYSEGVSSAREVERRCGYHPAYQWLTGMEAVNHHTLSDFRIQHQVALDDLFAQRLGVFSAEGLITLKRVMHDGTKVKAAASGSSFHREKTLRVHLEAAREQVQAMGDPRQEEPGRRAARARERAARERVERLEQALEEIKKVQAASGAQSEKSERRVSGTDPESRIMKQGDGGYGPNYNVQLSTDAAHSIIVGVSVTPSASDHGQLLSALEEVKKNLGRLPQQVVADGGFTTRETVVKLERQGVDYVGGAWAQPSKRGKGSVPAPALAAEAFHYDVETNTYTCPQGRTLSYRGVQHDRVGAVHHVYHAQASDCAACALRAQCCQGKGKYGRMLSRLENAPVVANFLAKMQTEAAKAIYRLRGAVAEFPNAWLKAKIGLRQFRVRGLKKVRCEALWACLTYNVQQWFRFRWKARLTPAQA